MNPTARIARASDSLRLRLAVMLSIAILPLGVVAVMQTAAVVRDATVLEERDILARTVTAVNTERALLRRAYGAARALGASVVAVGPETDLCGEIMDQFVSRELAYVFAGFIEADGTMRCSSAEGMVDFSDHPDWISFVEDPRPMVEVNTRGALSGQSVVITTMPVYDPETADFLGGASISLPHALTDSLMGTDDEAVWLALLNASGDVLSASSGISDIGHFTSLELVPSELEFGPQGYRQELVTDEGNKRVAVLVPLIEDRIFVLGLWDGRAATYSVPFLGTAAPLFPVLMWGVALIVAILAIDRLVLRHLNELKRRMVGFSLDEPAEGFAFLSDPPAEIASIAAAYNHLIYHILSRNREMEENVREKELLLREVHHRVKNNLQLIASILNMQMRNIGDARAKSVLRRVQDRVMSLSFIHKALYTGQSASAVRADELLHDVIQAALKLGLPPQARAETKLGLKPVALETDQAVSFALLTNELITNATKNLGRPAGKIHPRISVDLHQDGRDTILRIENSLGTPVQEEIIGEGTGLGQRLIDAFVAQLGASITTDAGDEHYAVEIRFEAFENELNDGGTTEAGAGDPALGEPERVEA